MASLDVNVIDMKGGEYRSIEALKLIAASENRADL